MSIETFSGYLWSMNAKLTYDGENIVPKEKDDNITFEATHKTIQFLWIGPCANTPGEILGKMIMPAGLGTSHALLQPGCCGLYPKDVVKEITKTNPNVMLQVLENFNSDNEHGKGLDHLAFANALMKEKVIRVCETLPVEFVPRLLEAIALFNLHRQSKEEYIGCRLFYIPHNNRGEQGPYEETAFCEFTKKDNRYELTLTPRRYDESEASVQIKFSINGSSVSENQIISHRMCDVEPRPEVVSKGLPALLKLLEVLKRIAVSYD